MEPAGFAMTRTWRDWEGRVVGSFPLLKFLGSSESSVSPIAAAAVIKLLPAAGEARSPARARARPSCIRIRYGCSSMELRIAKTALWSSCDGVRRRSTLTCALTSSEAWMRCPALNPRIFARQRLRALPPQALQHPGHRGSSEARATPTARGERHAIRHASALRCSGSRRGLPGRVTPVVGMSGGDAHQSLPAGGTVRLPEARRIPS
jgi:hypothetical protein